MTIRSGRFAPPNPRATVFFAVLAALALVGVLSLGSRHMPEAKWPLLVAFVSAVACAHYAFANRWSAKFRRIIEALTCVADGSEPWGKDNLGASMSDSLGGHTRLAVDRLSEAVKALREDKRRAETVLANMADGVMAVNFDRTITVFNRAASSLLDQKQNRALGKRLEDLDLHPEVARVVDECISNRNEVVSEIHLPGWPQRVVSLRATPYRGVAAGHDCAIIILHDLSEAKRHEKSQREFVSNVGHELRTPLTAVRTTAEALLSGAKNDRELLDRFLSTIMSESDRLSMLVDDLMEIVRISSGITKTEETECSMADVVSRALDAVRPQASVKNIELKIDILPDLSAYCDGMQMIQVVRNLVDNAVKYTHSGGSVEIRADRHDADVVVSVKDTGIGIPHGEIDRIFERFYRVDKARSRRIGGTGLGLAIVKDIIDAHCGKITVDTELGKGSTFTVTLPPKSVRIVSGTEMQSAELAADKEQAWTIRP